MNHLVRAIALVARQRCNHPTGLFANGHFGMLTYMQLVKPHLFPFSEEDQMSLRTIRVAVVSGLLAGGIVACDSLATAPSADSSTEFARESVTNPSTTASVSSMDSLQWVDDVLEFTGSDGTQWRWERFGPDGEWTDVVIYRNGVLHSQTELRWADGAISTARWEDKLSTGWFESYDDGVIYADDTSSDADTCDSEGGGGEGGESGDDEGGEPGECDEPMGAYSFSTYSVSSDCDEHKNDRNGELVNAVGHSILAIFALKNGQKKTGVEEGRQAVESAHAAYEHHREYKRCLDDESGEEDENAPPR